MLTAADKISIAEALYLAGFKPNYSSNICDVLIAGYGILDYDFEYPLCLDSNGDVEICFQVKTKD